MRDSKESFEETQRRVTGRQPTLTERIASLRNHGKLLNVFIPAVFVAVVPMLVLRDILEEQNLPLYVFAAIGAVVFIAVFLQLTYRETSNRPPTQKRRGSLRRR
ncbi:MAG: hypothetical protein HKN81_05240 [Gammaproteobacteria bacterium]|nr:hypothetical protein [Gammaproteobacteria bacterium]